MTPPPPTAMTAGAKILVAALVLMVLFSLYAIVVGIGSEPPSTVAHLGSHDFYEGDYGQATIIGHSLPGTWRPFADDSPWNTPIGPEATIHPDSAKILFTLQQEARHLQLIGSYLCPIWVVNADNLPHPRVRSDRIFDTWDADYDGWSDAGVPLVPSMYGEPTSDGQICVIDPFKMVLWDLSSYRWDTGPDGPFPRSTTLDVWDLRGSGVADPPEDTRWVLRGGRGSGFPALAGMIRPEELDSGAIRHALCFSFPKNRGAGQGAAIFLPPASRSDGTHLGSQYPVQGMRFQLDPALTEKDFDRWGLNREGKIVARALQTYGMYLGLTGGAMKLEVQLLGPDAATSRRAWETRHPGFYDNIERIPVDAFRLVHTGEPRIRFWLGELRPASATD